MRSKVNPTVTSDVSGRFVELVEDHLRMPWADVANVLGYSNRTTLDAIRQARALPGLDKIYVLAKLRAKDGRRPNIDWLFSSEGAPLIDQRNDFRLVEESNSLHSATLKAIEKLPTAHHKALAEIVRLLGENIVKTK